MLKFTWNSTKAAINSKKHRVAFEEATSVFGDPLEVSISDPDHSEGEYRYISIGVSEQGRLLVVSYVEEEANSIHIISARRATRGEQKQYESNIGK